MCIEIEVERKRGRKMELKFDGCCFFFIYYYEKYSSRQLINNIVYCMNQKFIILDKNLVLQLFLYFYLQLESKGTDFLHFNQSSLFEIYLGKRKIIFHLFLNLIKGEG